MSSSNDLNGKNTGNKGFFSGLIDSIMGTGKPTPPKAPEPVKAEEPTPEEKKPETPGLASTLVPKKGDTAAFARDWARRHKS